MTNNNPETVQISNFMDLEVLLEGVRDNFRGPHSDLHREPGGVAGHKR